MQTSYELNLTSSRGPIQTMTQYPYVSHSLLLYIENCLQINSTTAWKMQTKVLNLFYFLNILTVCELFILGKKNS
jgi:hypothetical protein